MQPLCDLIPGVLNSIVRRAPLSPEKISMAWQIAVGPSIARSSRAELTSSGTLVVRFEDRRWMRAVERSTQLISDRLRELLGSEVFVRLALTAPQSARSRSIADPPGSPPR